MSGYLICEDGPYSGVVISLVDSNEWIIGRDPDLCFFVLEDPMVSRKHLIIRMEGESFFLENLSTVNPALINGAPITPEKALEEDDSIQIGNSFFRFSTTNPSENPDIELHEKPKELPKISTFSRLSILAEDNSRWMIKVISGPNCGAEFSMNIGESYVFGKDPALSDIVFQDLSVSKQHARISLSADGIVTLEDLGSRNGTIINGMKIETQAELKSQDLISLGTTVCLLIDRESAQNTIYSPSPSFAFEKEEEKGLSKVTSESTLEKEEGEEEAKNWKETFIPNRHLLLASIFSLIVFVGFVSLLALFRSQTVVEHYRDESKEISETLARFPNVQFSFNPANGKIFLMGHVLTDLDHSELVYLVKSFPFIQSLEDNVVADEGVWESMNALISKNPAWRGILITSLTPGRFVMRGYLPSEAEAIPLQDFVNLNFPYLSSLDNQVIVEDTLQTQLQSLLIEKGFVNVSFQLNNGDVIFTGRVNVKQEKEFEKFLQSISAIQGVRQTKNFVIYTTDATARIDLSDKYKVVGSSKFGQLSQYVLINGRILATGDTLDGMTITDITSGEIMLDKDGIKYKISYNQQ